MKIGIDVDGVLLDFEKELLVQAEIFDIEKSTGKGIKYKEPYFIQYKYDWTKEERIEFIKENLGKVSRKSNLMPGVTEVLPRLQKQGHELIIISARGTESEKMIDIVKEKFEKAGLNFDKCFWKIKNKVSICKEENIDIMIDDSPVICEEMIQHDIKTIYFRGIRGCDLPESPYLIEVTNWGEIYRLISMTNAYRVKPGIIEHIAENIFPIYIKYSEDGHGLQHIKDVINRSFEIVDENRLEVNRNMVYVIAAYHDIGNHVDRKTHELISADMFMQDENMKKWFTNEERNIIKEAIEDHRASCNHKPRNIYGMIVSAADRTIFNIENVIRRIHLYGLKNYPELTEEQEIQRIYDHLSEKYGQRGYAKIYLEDKKINDALYKLRNELSNREEFVEKIRNIIEEMKKSL